MQELKNQADSASNKIEFNEERIRESTALSARYQAEIAAAEEKVLVQQSQLDETDSQLREIADTLRTDGQRLEEQQNQANQCRSQRQDVERSAQDFQRQMQQRESRIAALRGDLSSTINQRESGETRLELLQRELAQIESTQSQVGAMVSQTGHELEVAQAKVQSCRDALNDSEHELTNRQRELQQVDIELVAKQRTLTERESKLEVLKQLNEEGAGLGAGTQAVLKGLDNPQLYRAAIVGALANFIEVSSEFIPAIEAALGQHLQTIFISDPAIAESIACALAERKVGRAALIPTPFLPKRNETQVQSLPEGALAWALDRIKSSLNVSPLVNRLLDNVVIASNLRTAFEIKRNAPDLAVATTVGEFISREGVVFTGFIGDNNNSVLQRKIQIQQLEKESLSLRSIVQALEKEKARYLAQAEINQRTVRENRDAFQRVQLEASTLQGQLSLLDRELREAEGKIKSLNWERDNVRQRLNTATGRVESLDQEISENGLQLGDLQTHLAAALVEVDSLRAEEETLIEILNELKVRVATGRQLKDNLERQRQPMTVRLTELEDLIASRRRDIGNYAARVEQFSTENVALRARIGELQTEWDEAEAEVARLLQDRAQSMAALEAVELSLRYLRKQLSECQEMRGQHEVRATQLNLRLEHIREHAAHRYQVDITNFQPDWYSFQVSVREQRRRLDKPPGEMNAAQSVSNSSSTQEIDWDFIQSAIAELTERLDAMGPVNLEAIQEYDELEERQRFLEDQHNDLVKSKNELLDVINKINTTTQELFADTFEQVRLNFQEMFTELFGGGKANLLLVDDADPLESGIEIIARPPGKQLQSISLLSGGERTMAAVSLLFAIYMVKPSPFCVLDEMDAPLDESNINRFIKILDHFVHQSQFVVITHNKRTIAKADVLYGVTMEEHGISKLVGVKLTQRDSSIAETDLIGTTQSNPSIAESFGKHSNLRSET